MDSLKRIAAINDISGLGKCSLTVALPVISATGVECSVIPTALLSTHTGVFSGWTLEDLSEQILPIANHWHEINAHFDGIFTGYLANPAQGELIRKTIELLRSEDTKVIVDPAMADNGKYYSNLDEGMTKCFQDLFQYADIVTPNFTEACFLAGVDYEAGPVSVSHVEMIMDRILDLGPSTVVVTSVSLEENNIGMLSKEKGSDKVYQAMAHELTGMFHGAGDVFASAFSALLIRGAELADATEIAMRFTSDAIGRTAARGTPRHYGLDFESALPAYVLEVDRYFKRD